MFLFLHEKIIKEKLDLLIAAILINEHISTAFQKHRRQYDGQHVNLHTAHTARQEVRRRNSVQNPANFQNKTACVDRTATINTIKRDKKGKHLATKTIYPQWKHKYQEKMTK